MNTVSIWHVKLRNNSRRKYQSALYPGATGRDCERKKSIFASKLMGILHKSVFRKRVVGSIFSLPWGTACLSQTPHFLSNLNIGKYYLHAEKKAVSDFENDFRGTLRLSFSFFSSRSYKPTLMRSTHSTSYVFIHKKFVDLWYPVSRYHPCVKKIGYFFSARPQF